MPRDDLKNLPKEVKVLVNDGIYSLYAVMNRPGVSYILLTDTRDVYALSSAGDVLVGVPVRLGDLELGPAARFEGLDPRPALKLNYA
jgi:hypothetical protein